MSARRVVVGMLAGACAREAPPPSPRPTPSPSSAPAVAPATASASALPTPPPPAPVKESFELKWQRVGNDGVAAPEDFAKNPFSGRIACDGLRNLDQEVPFRFQPGADRFAMF